MRSTRLQILLALAIGPLLISFFGGCGGASGVRVTEGSEQIGAAPTGSLFRSSAATVVHVNANERLVTLRNARGFPTGAFLETRNPDGEQTGVLKSIDNRDSGLRTADIVEGSPMINDRATAVSEAENQRLSQIYQEPADQ